MINKINIKDILRVSKQKEVRPLHIILGTRDHKKLGEIDNIDQDSISAHFQLQSADEFSFTVKKEVNGEKCRLWDEIIDLRLIWVKEYNEWFEITLNRNDEQAVTEKVVTCTSQCEAELCQTKMDSTEINTEKDPNWTDDKDEYIPTVFWQAEKPDYSLLHRVLKKNPNYTIKHVDETLVNIQRTFSISNSQSVYDCLVSTIAKEIGCLFLFDSDERGIYVYDLETTCYNCGERFEEDVAICPECGSNNLSHPYGSNTAIYIDKYNLGNSLQVNIDTNSVKNCFKIEGGDDNITAAVRNINPSGSNYWYTLSEEVRHDMPDELVKKFDDYHALVDEYNNTKEFNYTKAKVDAYNKVINNIKKIYADSIEADEDFFPYNTIQTQYKGYSNIVKIFYDTIDLKLYLHDSMMPNYIQADENAQQQMNLLVRNLSIVSLEKFKNCTQGTSQSAVLMFARAIIDTSRFKIEIETTKFTKDTNTAQWYGNITITSYSDKEDTVTQKGLNVLINGDYSNYIQQMVQKLIAKVDTQGIKDIFNDKLSLDEFKRQLHYYCYASLDGFYNAYQTCLDLFVEAKISDPDSDKTLYDKFYKPYFDRFKALESEMKTRDNEISAINAVQEDTVTIMDDCAKALDFEEYLGDLYLTFLNYRREDTYKNENYISDGLTNAEIIDKANELIKIGKKELFKSNNRQYSITGNITNLLLIKDENGNCPFDSWLDDFSLGNYIHTKIDGEVYNMRLADVSIQYNDLKTLSVTFYDVTKGLSDTISQANKILETVKTIGSSYDSTKKQASQGESANEALTRIQKEGLNSAQYFIFNEDTTVSMDEHGILCRALDDITNEYSPNQSRLGRSGLIFTNNGWETTITALGRQKYTFNGVTYDEYGLNAQMVISGKIIAGDIYSADFKTDSKGNCLSGTHINLNDGSFIFAGGKLKYDPKDGLILGGGVIRSANYGAGKGAEINLEKGSFNFANKLVLTESGGLTMSGDITSSRFIGGGIYSSNPDTTTPNTYLKLSDGTFSFANGKLTYDGKTLNVSEIYATTGSIGGWTINRTSLSSGNTILYNNGQITCGSLYAQNSGKIGNWSISSSGLSDGQLSGLSSFDSNSSKTPFGGGAVTQIDSIVADKITALDLETTYATIGSLDAVTARIDSIESDYITTDELEAVSAKFDDITYQDIGMIPKYANLLPIDISADGTAQVKDTDGNQISVITGHICTNSVPVMVLAAG